MNGETRSSPTNHQPLAQEASELRAQLAATLQALDRRIHNFFDVKQQLRKHLMTLTLMGTGTLLLIGGTISLALIRNRQRSQHMYRERWLALKRFWKHPERIG